MLPQLAQRDRPSLYLLAKSAPEMLSLWIHPLSIQFDMSCFQIATTYSPSQPLCGLLDY
ncbi:hypothetical protein L207DRAFT_520692 [Hyaloscypha variabilis F]|uniref:Uncharacterized protein n=1 Tax=Hyaloscypha variabilis (strain UAMH 11265 / GT02V1 / F) TaxID=1149755 RepID=A0A2J6QU82_HYAVF|nr:hypothetical protein L207DRAFT_520692 [Hyaloscypha variabilis F]